ncbi:MAG: YggS family pyridoxal phosphate-dependent enzyme [Selenomonadaceae bacterium]|nr:YggS family pyridoxal phosphate-dependent enzyme [Selenomonadaceae bacterium]
MIAENYKNILKKIEAAKERRTRASKKDNVTLVAVTKNHDVNAMREAIDAGATDIGENRVQEAREKFQTLNRNATWHLIGHLQTNKAKFAVEMFDLIHSVDSFKLAKALNDAAQNTDKVQNILVQVNLAKEAQKFGVFKEDLSSLVEEIDEMEHLKLKGIMLIAPNFNDKEETRPLFSEMYDIFTDLKTRLFKRAEINILSMGMTGDFETAVEEGANLVRVGTGIFGARNYL